MGFSQKSREDTGLTEENLDRDLKEDLLKRSPEGRLACAVAFDIAENRGKTPAEIGNYADFLGLRLAKCQMGLFGYSPENKKVSASESVPDDLERAITGSVKDGRLSCRDAWGIARKLRVPKMKVSSACEALKIKIIGCQLGAF